MHPDRSAVRSQGNEGGSLVRSGDRTVGGATPAISLGARA